MKTHFLLFGASFVLSLSLVTGCTHRTQHPVTENSYTGAYVAPVRHKTPVVLRNDNVPRLDYVGFDANWHGGTPDYFNTGLIMND